MTHGTASCADHYALRRFLRARNWDVGLAKALWINSMAWRTSFGADKMLDEHVLTPERRKRLIDLFPHGLHGVDMVVSIARMQGISMHGSAMRADSNPPGSNGTLHGMRSHRRGDRS
jgi:hypothetical protein